MKTLILGKCKKKMSESKHVTYRENGNINAFHTVRALGEDIVV